jgi:hypothetical protein
MRIIIPILLFASILSGASPIVGDFDNELRTPEGRFDTPRMIEALKRLGANTYVYQIWHKPTDWDDLPEFAQAAAQNNINVWVWIMPWTMTPAVKKTGRYSEPFQLDYIRWAQEIARLSLKQPNIVGYIIDDFYTNTQADRFSADYVKKMVAAGRAVNPKIKFYPQLYFQQPWDQFMRRFGKQVDGVIVAYPESQIEVKNALKYLNGQPYGPSFIASFPRREPAAPEDHAAITADFAVRDANIAGLSFYWNHTNRSELTGYRVGYVKVNQRIVWEADCSSQSPDKLVDLDLSREAQGRKTITVEIGVAVKRKARFPLIVRMDDIEWPGLRFGKPGSNGWTIRHTEEIVPELTDGDEDGSKVRLPMLLMLAAEPYEHELRYSQPGTARFIARKMNIAADLANERLVEGVVTYCAPKDPEDPIFTVLRDAFTAINMQQ